MCFHKKYKNFFDLIQFMYYTFKVLQIDDKIAAIYDCSAIT